MIFLSFILLMFVFRSVLVPLKAALLNLLSIGAAYGVLVMVFQWGWGKELIGLDATVPVVSFIPMFMFAVLFGLSMDYEVFILSRIRESYDKHGDTDEAVVSGIAGAYANAKEEIAKSLAGVAIAVALVPPLAVSGIGLALGRRTSVET